MDFDLRTKYSSYIHNVFVSIKEKKRKEKKRKKYFSYTFLS